MTQNIQIGTVDYVTLGFYSLLVIGIGWGMLYPSRRSLERFRRRGEM